MKKLIALIVALGVLAYAADQAYARWNNGLAAVSNRSQQVVFTVHPGETADQVANDLQAKGLIRDVLVFDLYMRQTGDRSRIQAGNFVLNRDMTVPEIALALQHGTQDQIAVTLLPGWTMAQEAQAAQQAGVGTAAQYKAAASQQSWTSQFPFLKSKPAGATLEGFLAPDTYLLNKGSTPTDLIRKQLQNFGAHLFPSSLQAAASHATAARPAESVFNIVILASMVEKESTANDTDRGLVCSVLYNRLTQGVKLGVDATIFYALGMNGGDLTQADLNINSPYNTRKFYGLPPGPIAAPSADSINACVNPPKTNLLFYFTDAHGKMHFEENIDQFNSDIQQYGLGAG